MKIRSILFITSCLIFFSCNKSFSQEQVRIAVIFSSGIEQYQQSWKGFNEFLKEKKVVLQVSKYDLTQQKPEIIFSEIKKQKPDMVFVLGTRAFKLAKEKIKDIPLIFSTVLDDVITNLKVPGVLLDIPAQMKLKEIKKILPDKRRIGIIYSKKANLFLNEILQACKELDFKLVVKQIDSVKEFSDALNEIYWQIDCFLMIPDTEIYLPAVINYLLLESLRKKFSVIGLSSSYTKAGALVSFDCDYKDLGYQAGEIALKILQGENPADIQPSKPRKITFSLNLLASERLGLKIPSTIIKKANEVFGNEANPNRD